MSERVVFRPDGMAESIPFAEVDRTMAGAWGVVDDGAWLAAGNEGDALELLYLTPREYHHAVRGLSPDDARAVVEQRRSTFATRVPAVALGLIELRVRDCLGALGNGPTEVGIRADLLVALASFTAVPRYAGTPVPALLDYLREGDAGIIAELDSPSLRRWLDLDPSGDERATRRRFATEVGQLAAQRGHPDKARALPYVDVERAFLFTPVPADLESAADSFHDPTLRFAGGLIMPLPEREVADIEARGHRAAVVFATRGQFMGASSAMTSAQLQVEIAERLADPGFLPYLRALRLQQATLRASVHLIAGCDVQLAALLARHLEEENRTLGAWLAVGRDASTDGAGAAKAALGEAIDVGTFLVALFQRRVTLSQAGAIEALTRALSHVAAEFQG